MKRMALVVVGVLGCLGGGVVLAAPSGINRVVVAKGMTGDVHIQADGPVQVMHAIVTLEPGGTSDWISWPGTMVATMKTGELSYRNATEDACAPRTIGAGESFVIPGGTAFEAVNQGTEAAEIHTVVFLPPGQKLKLEQRPDNC